MKARVVKELMKEYGLSREAARELCEKHKAIFDHAERVHYKPYVVAEQIMDAEGRPIVALAQNIQAGFPLVNYAGVDWASPYAHLWMIPAIYKESWYDGAPWRYREAGEWRALEQQIFDNIWSTIEKKRPSLMLVQLPLTNGFDTREYFSTDPRFRALFDRATLVATVGHYWVVRLNYGS